MRTEGSDAVTEVLQEQGERLQEQEALSLTSLRVGYEKRVICESVDLKILRGSYTAIIGPNACGKSTLLRAVARVLPTMAGSVLLDGRDIREVPTRELATRLGLLPQTSLAPEGIRVADLVARGRYPHQGMFDRWSERDEAAVITALEATGITDLSGRLVEELSGGQRQRVWVAMALTQETSVLLLDEPTTFLDITHQYGLLALFERLRTGLGCTVMVVLHDLNQAARLEEVYDLPCRVMADPEDHHVLVERGIVGEQRLADRRQGDVPGTDRDARGADHDQERGDREQPGQATGVAASQPRGALRPGRPGPCPRRVRRPARAGRRRAHKPTASNMRCTSSAISSASPSLAYRARTRSWKPSPSSS